MKGYDEPEILPSSTHPICLMSADGGHASNPGAGAAISNSNGQGGWTDSSNTQLVQAMAGFGDGSGAGDGLNAGFNADTSQQTFLTTPQHG